LFILHRKRKNNMANTVFIGNILQRSLDIRQTLAYSNWKDAGGSGTIPDYVIKKAEAEILAKKEQINLAIKNTNAYKSWLLSGGEGDIPSYVLKNGEIEINNLISQGYTINQIISGKHLEGELPENQNGGNGGNAGGPNKMLLIGGAIAAAALLVLILRK